MTAGQKRFASIFAHETGLDPKVVGAWLLAEQSGSAAEFYQKKGYNNWLNIGRTDSGDAHGSHGSVWSDPDTAARVSAQWMRGEGQIAKEYGKPASGIMAILNSAGQGVHRQIQAISRSGWASSGYNGGATLSSLLGQTGNITASGSRVNPNALQGTQTTLNSAGLAAAQQQAAGIRNIEGLFPGTRPGDVLLREALEKAGQEPTATQFTSKSVVRTPTGTFYTPATSGYVHPIPGGKLGREDMGLDITAKPGTPIRAIGDSKVLGIHPGWYKNQPYVEMEFLNGPRKGQTWYAAEQITPQVKAGDYIRGGHAIGHVAPTGTGLELGFGARGGRTRAQATTGYTEGQRTPAGREFGQFVRGLR